MNTASHSAHGTHEKEDVKKAEDTKLEGKQRKVPQDVSNYPFVMDPNQPPKERAFNLYLKTLDPTLDPEKKKFAKLQMEEAAAELGKSPAEIIVMFEKEQKDRQETQAKATEGSIDSYNFDRTDPIIPEELKASGMMHVAVYECPEGHKTKATNRQESTGVWCSTCRDEGKKVKATLMKKSKETWANTPEAVHAGAPARTPVAAHK